MSAKKLKNEALLVKEGLRLGMEYGIKRGVVEFEATDSADQKIEFVYRLLVHDKLMMPLPELDISIGNIKHKLARWALKQLPADHSLKK
jgi:hypothetical protein